MTNFNTKKRSGFALILAIGAMAFMVLLTLTLSSVVSAKMRLLTAQKQARQARANALLGMSVAISDLQRTLGRDNAISFQASIFDSDPKTPMIDSVRSPYTLGVYKIEKENSDKTPLEIQEQNTQIFDKIRNGAEDENVTWLVSGEKKMQNPIIESPEDLSSESVTLASFKALSDYPAVYGQNITSSLKSEDVEVMAGKVSIYDGGRIKSGAYAFWISDESMKAKLNLTRPEKYLDEATENAQSAKAPADGRVPQISNLSFVDELQDLGINPFLSDYNEENAKKIARISSISEITLVSKNYEKWAKENMGDYTASSVGIPVDVTQGRLKEDLSVYLQTGLGLEDDEPIVRGSGKKNDSEYTGTKFEIKDFSDGLPQFGLLRDFAQIAENKTSFTDSVKPQARNISSNGEIKHGIYPLVKTVRWVMMPAFNYEDRGQRGTYEINRSDSPTIGLSILLWPRIVLWNPHNVKLDATDYVISVYMPFKIGMPTYSNRFALLTHWEHYSKETNASNVTTTKRNGRKSVLWVADTTIAQQKNLFKYFIKKHSDNQMPLMSFQVKGLALLPGETVELNIKSSGGTMQVYKDSLPNQLSGTDNLLEAGIINGADGPNNWVRALERKCIKIDTKFRFKIAPKTITPLDTGKTLVFNDSNKRWETSDGKEFFVPTSHIYAEQTNFYTRTPDPFLVVPNFYNGETNINGNTLSDVSGNYGGWRIYRVVTNGSTEYGGDAARAGYELFAQTNEGLKRLVKDDTTEWLSSSQMAFNDRRKNAYGNGSVTVGYGDIDMNYFRTEHYGSDGNLDRRRNTSLVINNEVDLFESTMGDDDLKTNGGRMVFAMDMSKTGTLAAYPFINYGNTNISSLFYSNGNLMQGIKLLGILETSTMVFTSSNMLATGLKSGDIGNIEDITDPTVIKRPGCGKDDGAGADRGNLFRFGTSKRFSSAGSNSYDVFFGKRSGNTYGGYGIFAYKSGSSIGGSTANQLKSRYGSGVGDSNPNRFAETSFLTGKHWGGGQYNKEGYYYDWLASAPFDWPRSKFDIMSLGAFSHANLSFYTWQPTFAFATSYASPYIERDKIVEKSTDSVQNPNQLIDISYILNSSMWDRFYLSSIPQKDMPQQVSAGMRLPNTRLFLTNVPQDKSKLYNSKDAFKNSAKYVGIDGAFNVNSTSYEAWRALLGGMLGTKKKTLLNTYINSESQDSKDPEKLKMPNPGDFMPLTTPETEKISWVDTTVGRTVSEEEIDMLAREIVAEVKRRAPFFSLADFVNRRLYQYEQGTDDEAMNIRYQSLMGTLAAAIRRAEVNEERPKRFFNDKDFDANVAYRDNSQGGSFVFTTADVRALDNYPSGSWKRDVGSELKEYTSASDRKYLEQTICSPILSNRNYWASNAVGIPGRLSQEDLLQQIGSVIAVRGDTFTVRAYGEALNVMTGTSSKAYCEAVVQRTTEPVEPSDDEIAPAGEFGRKFKIVSFRWLTPAEL